ncbi:MAG: hypothetical protein AB1767_05415 [Bacillota bacterium]
MRCEHCNQETNEILKHAGKNLCEDCFMAARSAPKICDPLSVRSARISRENQGQDGLSS